MIESFAILIVVNLVLLMAIGMIRQENPFDLRVLGLLIVADAAALLAAGIIMSGSSTVALLALATNLLPFLFAAGGIALLLLALSINPGKKHSGS